MSSAAVITGLGAVSAFGWGVEPLWRGLQAGRCAIGELTRFDPSAYRTHLAGQVPAEPPEITAALPRGDRLSLADRFAVAAAREAAADADLDPAHLDPSGSAGDEPADRDRLRVGVYFSSSTGGMLESEAFYAALAPDARPRLGWIAAQQVSAPGEAVGRALGVTGPVETISSACASGTLALGLALDALRSDEVDVAVAGGSDSLCRVTYGGFNSLRSVDEDPCRPFRADRRGLSLGEGAAVLVLETEAGARRRGRRVRARLLGVGSAGDAHHMTAPHPAGDGAGRALAAALADAGLEPSAVGSINAHGTGTPHNDSAEWAAFERVFGERAGELPVAATKGCLGHLLGSAGALEAVALVLCLENGQVHPAPGPGEVDPETPVDLVSGAPRPAAAAPAVSLNLAFGGCNAAVVLAAAG